MKLTFLLALMVPLMVSAQTVQQAPVVCDEAKKIFDQLENKYQEQLFWVGRHEDKSMLTAILVNTKTNTWSLIWLRGKVACLVDAGVDWNLEHKPDTLL